MEIIRLNLIPSGVNPICHAKQYDKGRTIRFELFNGLTPYTLQSGDTVTLNLRKPDNTIIESSVTATQGNKYVDLVTTEQICAVSGYNLGTFKIENGATEIGTLNFIMEVGKDVLANGIPSQSVIEDLDALVQEAVEAELGDNYYNKTETDEKVAALIDDTQPSENNTWSSQKSNTEISALNVNKSNSNVGAGTNTLKNTTGSNNTAVGVSALQNVTSGGYNVGVGRSAGDTITTGSNNTIVGYGADTNANSNTAATAVGKTAIAGEHSTALGANTGATGSYAVAVGDSAQAQTNNSLALGRKAKANFAGAVAIGTDDQGNGAEATEQDEFVFGTSRHKYKFPGKLRNLAVTSATPNPTLSSEIAPSIDTWSGSGATWSGSYWSLSEGDSISTSVNVEADSDYLIVLTVSNAVTPNAEVKPMTIALDEDSISIFGANDATWQVVLHTTNSGAVALSMGGATWSGRISNVSVKKVASYFDPALTIEGRNVHAYGTNIVVGNGHNKMALALLGNTAFGYESQVALNSGKGNTAVGIKTQKSLTNGSHNTAVGENVQEELTTGMYNTAMGFHTQEHLISGCWNVSVGNENLKDTTTGCNNTTMGRRALNSLIDGHKNTVMGAQAGFVRDGVWDTIASVHSNEQAFFGFQATQYGSGQQDKACAFGSHACSNENGLALGSYTQARGNGSVAIGTDASGNAAVAQNNNDFVLGTSNHRFILGNKVIIFNLDGTVTWETLT